MARNLFSNKLNQKRRQKNNQRQNQRAPSASDSASSSGRIECEILSLGHDGRGIARKNGKIQFVEGALPGEMVTARFIAQRSKFDELKVTQINVAAAERIAPRCQHIELCGGCSLQHMTSDMQIQYKQNVLKEQFSHFGNLSSLDWFEPLRSEAWGYRSKARLGVYFDSKKSQVLLGFREKGARNITDVSRCEVLDERIAPHLDGFRALVSSLSEPKILTQFEVAAGDDGVAVTARHVKALRDEDIDKLLEFSKANNFELYLQPGGAETSHKVWPDNNLERLSYKLLLPKRLNPEGSSSKYTDLSLLFHPKDFTQVNAGLNRQMVLRALECLDLKAEDRVLDLFCGLGNFTLPIAAFAKEVVGIEGSEAMVLRGQENAKHNALTNVSFHSTDLQTDFTHASWAKQGFDKILIDPPRSGALDVVRYLSRFNAKRVVYISCNPATLARDAGVLIDKGYTLLKAGVMDMFPHTSHVESIALFEKK